MPLKLYLDHHVPRAIETGLRLRRIDVLTAYQDGSHELFDDALLDRASALNRVLFSQDDDLLAEATKRQRAGIPFGGVLYAHQEDISIGQCVRDLEIIAAVGINADVMNQVIFLPL